MMTMIVPDDEEFANRRKRNRCEYLSEVFVFPLGFFVVVYCDGIPNQEETLLKKRDCPEFEAGKKGYEILR
jgi:hypothetical protein